MMSVNVHARAIGLRLLLPLALFVALGGSGLRGTAPTIAGGATIQGDVTCDSTVNSIDSLQILRSVAGFSISAPCLADAGDVNCDGTVNSVDSLRILRYVAGLTNATPDGCVPVGQALQSPPTSEELVAAALDAGEITYEESLRYRVLALYDLPGLPEEYRSPVIDWHAGGELSTEIEENRASLSQGLLTEIAPILARPNDPTSIFSNPPVLQGRSSPMSAAAWVSAPAAGGGARVWVEDSASAAAELATYADATTKVWNALPGIFRYALPDTPNVPSAAVNPDPAIDIYFVDFGGVDPREDGCDAVPTPANCTLTANGMTPATLPNAGNTWSSYVLISTGRQGDALLNTLTHELAHAGQAAYDAYEPMWLKDATATWVAFRVLQKINATQTYTYERLPEFYDGLHESVTRDEGLNRYGSWLFFLFASMEQGDGVVTSIWQEAAGPGKQNEDAVDLVFPFEERFDDFTVRNWNRDPVDPMYKDGNFTTPPRGDPTFPANLKPDLEVDLDFQGAGTHDISENPLPLSALYYRYTFGPGVKKVTFTNSVVGNTDAHIWAIPKIRGNWEEPEDWSRDEEHLFCRDTPDQEITEVIIILSNSDKVQALPGGSKLLMEAETDKCEASVTATYHFDDGYHEDWMVTADVEWVEDPDYLFGCNCRVFFPDGTIDWRWEYGWEASYSDPPCHDVDSGTIDAGAGLIVPDEQMMILWEDPTYPDHYVLTASALAPVSWFSECEGGERSELELWYLQPDWEPPPIIPTIPPFPTREVNPAAVAPPPDCRGPIFLVPKNATRFSGSCLDHHDAVSYLRYDWIVEFGQP